MSEQVSIAGTGMTSLKRRDLLPEELAMQAVSIALQNAGLESRDIGLVVFANALAGRLSDQGCVRAQSWLSAAGLDHAGMVNVDNSCASGSTAVHVAYNSVKAGEAPVLVVGVEKMWTGDRNATINAIEDALSAAERPGLRADLAPTASGSVFMGFNAKWANHQLAMRGTTVEEIAATAVKAHRLGVENPLAQYSTPITVEEVLQSRVVAAPLTRLMCSSFTDGGAAMVLSSNRSREWPLIRTSVLRSGTGQLEYHDRLGSTMEEALKASGIDRKDIDVLEIHDATSAEELYALEALGFFQEGEAGRATLAGDTLPGGSAVCVNPSGGLVARGHPLAATGICQIIELADQVTGHAGNRQQAGTRIGTAVNTGGIIAGDAAATSINIVERA
ncbi:MAG: thiolase family protein [Actinobacteria bacterium]|jgi:acetyl-CoA acetyltransferase|nr:thiolase family protein [Actinomycetota bacterium]